MNDPAHDVAHAPEQPAEIPADAPALAKPAGAGERMVWAGLIIVILGLGAAAIVSQFNAMPPAAGLQHKQSTLQVMKPVAQFTFKDQFGNTVTEKDLRGHVWVAGFIFTRCAGTCKFVTGNMREINRALAGDPAVRLVSFTMDPEYDTPEILKKYAKDSDAESPRWSFLTGDKASMYALVKDFDLAVKEGGSKDEPIIHATHLVLIDRTGHIRGYYSGTQPDGVQETTADIRRLRRTWDVYTLPAINATLNGLSLVLLLSGYYFIRRKVVETHKNFMTAAGLTSALFLVFYVVYHAQAGSKHFLGTGWIRSAYFAILISHVLLAVVIAVMVPMTFWRAYKDTIERHRALAKITFPIWVYVSVTGVVVYLMLYQMY